MYPSLFYGDRVTLEKQLKFKIARGMRLFFTGELKEKIELTPEEFGRVSRWTGKSLDPNLNLGEWWLENIFKQGAENAATN